MNETDNLSNKELKALISLLEDDDAEVLSHVEGKIKSLGTHIIPYLEFEWEGSFNPTVQKRIEELVHSLQFQLLKEKLEAWKETGGEDLLEGMWLVNTYQYPDLEYADLKKQLEQIYYEAWLEFKTDVHPVDQVKILNSVIFNKLKFGANTKNFHSPGNSMMSVVLQTQKLKLPIHGVNLPNLFVLTYKQGETQFYINAFNRGLIFSRKEIDDYVANLKLTPKDQYYEPCTNVDMVVRVLRNLSIAHEKLGNSEKVDEIKSLIEILADKTADLE